MGLQTFTNASAHFRSRRQTKEALAKVMQVVNSQYHNAVAYGCALDIVLLWFKVTSALGTEAVIIRCDSVSA